MALKPSNMIPGSYESLLFDANLGLEIAKGNVPGYSVGTMFGRNRDLNTATESLIWDFGPVLAREVYLTADTELFISSSSALDVNIGVLITGMTDDYVNKTELHLHVAGQTQQSIGNWFRVFKATVVSGSFPLGDLYFTEADTLTLGVPNTVNKVHAFLGLGSGTTHKATCTVPANHTLHLTRMFLGTRRGEDAVFNFRVRGIGFPDFIEASNFPMYQSSLAFTPLDPPFPITEKTDFEFTATTVTNNSQGVANIGYILVDNTV